MDFDGRSNDFAAKPVCLLDNGCIAEAFLQKATKKTKILIWLGTDPLRSLRLLLLACPWITGASSIVCRSAEMFYRRQRRKTKIQFGLNLRYLCFLLLVSPAEHSAIATQQSPHPIARPGQNRRAVREEDSLGFVIQKFSQRPSHFFFVRAVFAWEKSEPVRLKINERIANDQRSIVRCVMENHFPGCRTFDTNHA